MDDRAAALLASVDARGFRDYLRETGNTICGRNGLATMLELLPRIAPKARAVPLAHYASGELPGMQDDSSVSYVAMAFLREAPAGASFGPPLLALPRLEDAPPETPSLSPDEGARLVRLARAALATHFFERDDLGRELAAWPTGPERERRQGVFVTLNRTDPAEVRAKGRLRGCIGQPEPTFPLYYGTVQAALDAALRDPRFEPVDRRRARPPRGRGHGPLAAEAGRLLARHPARHARHRPAEGRQGRALPPPGGARAGLDARADADRALGEGRAAPRRLEGRGELLRLHRPGVRGAP